MRFRSSVHNETDECEITGKKTHYGLRDLDQECEIFDVLGI